MTLGLLQRIWAVAKEIHIRRTQRSYLDVRSASFIDFRRLRRSRREFRVDGRLKKADVIGVGFEDRDGFEDFGVGGAIVRRKGHRQCVGAARGRRRSVLGAGNQATGDSVEQ